MRALPAVLGEIEPGTFDAAMALKRVPGPGGGSLSNRAR
jgi:hypothetical protein